MHECGNQLEHEGFEGEARVL